MSGMCVRLWPCTGWVIFIVSFLYNFFFFLTSYLNVNNCDAIAVFHVEYAFRWYAPSSKANESLSVLSRYGSYNKFMRSLLLLLSLHCIFNAEGWKNGEKKVCCMIVWCLSNVHFVTSSMEQDRIWIVKRAVTNYIKKKMSLKNGTNQDKQSSIKQICSW